MSAKAFGWTKQSGGAGYRYLAMGGDSTASVVGGSTVAGATYLPTQPTNNSTGGMIGVVADGSFIALSGGPAGYFSLNNGASWTSFGGTPSSVYLPPGLNGAMAYSSNGGKYAAMCSVGYDYKAASYSANLPMVSRTGSYANIVPFTLGPSPTFRTLMYSPTLNTFYITGWGSGEQSNRYIDGTSTSVGGTASTTTSNFRFGVSKDGYPIVPVYQGGFSWSLREYTAADLSTYNALGSVSGSYVNSSKNSPWTWLPVNNVYILGSANNTGSSVYVQTSTSGSPASLLYVGSASVATYAVTSINFMEETTGRIWMSGWAINQDSKGGYYNITYSYYSDDAGVSWATNNGHVGASKNFT
jgi:hypothetical protein